MNFEEFVKLIHRQAPRPYWIPGRNPKLPDWHCGSAGCQGHDGEGPKYESQDVRCDGAPTAGAGIILGGRMLGFTITELVRMRQLLNVLDVTVDELLERHGISRKGMSQNG